MVIEETLNREDPWRCRVAIARSFKSIAKYLQTPDTLTIFDLLLAGGALGDRSGEVRSEMLSVRCLQSADAELVLNYPLFGYRLPAK